MTPQSRKKCSVLISLILVLGFIAPASAGDFSTAMNYVFLSNTYFSAGTYYMMLALYYYASDIDPTSVAYTALSNIQSAASNASSAYSYANTGYFANPNAVTLNARTTAYYDYYYKNLCANALEEAIYSDSDTPIVSTIWYTYLSNYWHGYAAYWTGLASNGGYN